MKILALDTSTEACSAALWLDGTTTERYELAPRRHAVLLLPMIDSLLSEADLALQALDGLAFGRGPGAFTGVRIATGVVQGLAFAADLPVVPISSLAALAQGAARTSGASQVLAAIDARMNEVYWGRFVADEEGVMRPDGPEAVAAPGEVGLPAGGRWTGVGSGWGAHHEALAGRLGSMLVSCDPESFPRAADVARLGAADMATGGGLPAEEALPVYLRDKVASPGK